ncbi:MAG: DNA polymerase/3'-5' exonuclease PolX [Candidatus Marinimicrobia bacterium]|nr:DNA polymerase/3'-5' exonuclease PolX [Candidatus Neomarinimicrobiota bacterium]
MKNRELARELRKIADIMEIRKIQWKPEAYRSASRKIENMDENIGEIYEKEGKKGLQNIPSIGQSLADHIAEYIEKGKVRKWEKTKKQSEKGLPELLKIEGLGPNKVRQLSEELNIKNISDLRKAAEQNRISKLEGFGKKTEQNLLRSIEQYRERHERMLIGEAWEIAEETIGYLQDHTDPERIDYAGSLRRMKETIGDIDILAVTKDPEKLMDVFTDMKNVTRVLLKGESKSSVVLSNHINIDLRIIDKKSYGAALLYFTGSKDHNIQLRKMAMEKDYKLSEYGLFKGHSKKRIAERKKRMSIKNSDCNGYHRRCGKIPERSKRPEKDHVPELVEAKDIRGDLHMHTAYSDGYDTIRDMAKKAKDRGYDYIAVTDHSLSERIAGGMKVKDIKKQWKEIGEIGDSEGVSILKGAEVDILPDGSLDYEDDILKELDIVLAAVHSRFRSDKEEMTERILKALDNRYVNVLVHPTGRMINKREGYHADFDRIFKACASNHVALEINSDPRRLDLNGKMITSAKTRRKILTRYGCSRGGDAGKYPFRTRAGAAWLAGKKGSDQHIIHQRTPQISEALTQYPIAQ